MDIKALRDELNISQSEFARLIGLRAKSYVSELEKGDTSRCSVKTALEIERLSGGRIAARDLNPDVRLVEEARSQ